MASELPWNEADQALATLDKALSEKPEKPGHDFSKAMHHLTAFRQGVTEHVREANGEADRIRLRRLNGVINAVYAGHFPLGPVPWDVVQKARESFADLLDELRTG